MPAGSQEILERLSAAAAQRGLAGPTLAAYRRVWRDTVIRAASVSLDPAALPQARAEEFYSELTRGRGASCHLQVKAALALLYCVLDAPNPFADCLAPKFRPDAVEIRHLEGGALGKVLLELRRHRRDYFDHLVSHLAEALFFTACRFHEWALLSRDRLVYDGAGRVTAARLKVKSGKHRDVPVMPRLGASLAEWAALSREVQGAPAAAGPCGLCGQ